MSKSRDISNSAEQFVQTDRIQIMYDLLKKNYKSYRDLSHLIKEDKKFPKQNIETSYIDLFILNDKEKNNILPKNILPENFLLKSDTGDKQSYNRSLIYGGAGLGNTTFIHKLSYEWAKNDSLSNNEYRFVLWLPLNKLSKELKEYRNDDGINLEHFVYHCCFRDTNSYEKKIKLKDVEELLKYKEDILFLLDGYDEIANLNEENRALRNRIMKLILSYPNVIMTSKPNIILDEFRSSFDKVFHNKGFNIESIYQYLNNYFANNKILNETEIEHVATLIARENHKILEIFKTPMNLYIFCSIIENEKGKIIDRLKKQELTVTDIYYEIVKILMKKYLIKIKGRSDIDMLNINDTEIENVCKEEYIVHENLAWEIRNSKDKIVSKDKISELSTDSQNILKNFNIIKVIDSNDAIEIISQNHSFAHSTIQEFMLARSLHRKLCSEESLENKKAVEFIEEKKYDYAFERVILFVAGLVSINKQKNKAVKLFWNILVNGKPDLNVISQYKLIMFAYGESKFDPLNPYINQLKKYLGSKQSGIKKAMDPSLYYKEYFQLEISEETKVYTILDLENIIINTFEDFSLRFKLSDILENLQDNKLIQQAETRFLKLILSDNNRHIFIGINIIREWKKNNIHNALYDTLLNSSAEEQVKIIFAIFALEHMSSNERGVNEFVEFYIKIIRLFINDDKTNLLAKRLLNLSITETNNLQLINNQIENLLKHLFLENNSKKTKGLQNLLKIFIPNDQYILEQVINYSLQIFIDHSNQSFSQTEILDYIIKLVHKDEALSVKLCEKLIGIYLNDNRKSVTSTLLNALIDFSKKYDLINKYLINKLSNDNIDTKSSMILLRLSEVGNIILSNIFDKLPKKLDNSNLSQIDEDTIDCLFKLSEQNNSFAKINMKVLLEFIKLKSESNQYDSAYKRAIQGIIYLRPNDEEISNYIASIIIEDKIIDRKNLRIPTIHEYNFNKNCSKIEVILIEKLIKLISEDDKYNFLLWLLTKLLDINYNTSNDKKIKINLEIFSGSFKSDFYKMIDNIYQKHRDPGSDKTTILALFVENFVDSVDDVAIVLDKYFELMRNKLGSSCSSHRILEFTKTKFVDSKDIVRIYQNISDSISSFIENKQSIINNNKIKLTDNARTNAYIDLANNELKDKYDYRLCDILDIFIHLEIKNVNERFIDQLLILLNVLNIRLGRAILKIFEKIETIDQKIIFDHERYDLIITELNKLLVDNSKISDEVISSLIKLKVKDKKIVEELTVKLLDFISQANLDESIISCNIYRLSKLNINDKILLEKILSKLDHLLRAKPSEFTNSIITAIVKLYSETYNDLFLEIHNSLIDLFSSSNHTNKSIVIDGLKVIQIQNPRIFEALLKELQNVLSSEDNIISQSTKSDLISLFDVLNVNNNITKLLMQKFESNEISKNHFYKLIVLIPMEQFIKYAIDSKIKTIFKPAILLIC